MGLKRALVVAVCTAAVAGACWAVAFLGYVAKRLVKSPEDYFAGGKRVPWWMAAVSHHVSGYSAVLFVGHTSVTVHSAERQRNLGAPSQVRHLMSTTTLLSRSIPCTRPPSSSSSCSYS